MSLFLSGCGKEKIRFRKSNSGFLSIIFPVCFLTLILSPIRAVAADTGALQAETPTAMLFSAVSDNNPAMAGQALLAGANIKAENALLETPLQMAVDLNRVQIIFLLLPRYHRIYPLPPLVQEISVPVLTELPARKFTVRRVSVTGTAIRKKMLQGLPTGVSEDNGQVLLTESASAESPSVKAGVLNGELPLTAPPVQGLLAG